MRQFVWFFSILVTVYLVFIPTVQSEKEERIPDEAIRLRILANSNSETDQQLKLHVRDRVNYYIADQVKTARSKVEVRTIIEDSLAEIEDIIEETIHSDDFTVRYSEAVDFPEKTYGDYVYPAGKYEALQITIGEGVGDNWWCVLFPPLCFVEFSDEASASEDVTNDKDGIDEGAEKTDETIRFFFWEWFTS